MNPQQNWTTVKAAATQPDGKDASDLFSYSATCYYFGESLIDKLGPSAPPIGLIHTAWGGSRIESWVDNETLATCANSSGLPIPASEKRGLFHQERVLPYLDSSIKGWVW
jgi:sialate O-acetylesterase